MTLAQNANMSTRMTPSEHWNGFTFEFSNGWSVSIQQGKDHYCERGKTAEVLSLTLKKIGMSTTKIARHSKRQKKIPVSMVISMLMRWQK